MPKRILQISEEMPGIKTAREYLEMQKRIGRFYFKKLLYILKSLAKQGSFLEIGPGPGYQTAKIAQIFHETNITALEYSKDMIQVADEYIKDRGLKNKVKFIYGSVEDTRLLDSLGKFDVIYSTFSLHHWADPKAVFSNLYNSLNNEGIIIIYDFIRNGIFYYFFPRKGSWASIRASYNPDEIGKIINDSGIQKFNIETKYPYMWTIIRK